ncbi:MAG: hypothetical protein HYU69_14725 [Bacteroidetes bacterium]|nr:hypothetical protein [Bacteroidota bacterium]
MLSKNWLTEKHIDFEYKKYVVLAYIKEVSENFESNRLYPSLSELVEHYRQLISIKENKQHLKDAFPQRMQQVDMERFLISYEKMVEDDALMAELESIIEYSIPQFKHSLSEGKKIYDFIEEQLSILPVGVMPLYPEQGYMFIKNASADTVVYEYQITIFQQPDEKYRGIHTTYVKSYTKNFINTYEYIKTDLVRENKNLPNPAAFAVESDLKLPLEQTLLPIAKRALVKKVSAGE